jgi:drug/metabolite transporter (DMT)-like permease
MSRRTLAISLAFLAVYIIWGSTYYAIRVAIDTMPPLFMAGTRFLLAGVLLYAVAIRLGDRRGDRPTRQQWKSAFIIGLLLLGVGNGGVTFGEQKVATGIAALLVATVPLWIAVFAHMRGVERMSRLSAAGLVVGFLGVGLLLKPGGTSSPIGWMLIVLAAPLGWSLGSMYAREAVMPRRPLVATAMEMMCGGLVLLAGATLHGEWSQVHLSAIALPSLLAFAYLIVFGSIVAYTAYVWLLNQVSPAAVSTYAYVNPLVAVLLGAAFLGEPLTLSTILAGALIVVAVAIILAGRGRRRAGGRRPQAAAVASPARIGEVA